MLNTINRIAVFTLLVGLVTGCAQTATELDFGNSVRALAAAQTMHPEGQEAAPESGDGARLENVVDDYREGSGARVGIADDVRRGVSGARGSQ